MRKFFRKIACIIFFSVYEYEVDEAEPAVQKFFARLMKEFM